MIDFDAASRWIGGTDSVGKTIEEVAERGSRWGIDLSRGFPTPYLYDDAVLQEAACAERAVRLQSRTTDEVYGVLVRRGSVTATQANGWITKKGDDGAELPEGQRHQVTLSRADDGHVRVIIGWQ